MIYLVCQIDSQAFNSLNICFNMHTYQIWYKAGEVTLKIFPLSFIILSDGIAWRNFWYLEFNKSTHLGFDSQDVLVSNIPIGLILSWILCSEIS